MPKDAVDSVTHKIKKSRMAVASAMIGLVGWVILLFGIPLGIFLNVIRVGIFAPLAFILLPWMLSPTFGICALMGILRKNSEGKILAATVIIAPVMPFIGIAFIIWHSFFYMD
ncbi:MAG: hypothetical protein ACYSWP_17550 [Planctomycetota bacterium]|jgi:hypothetical protein